MAGLLENIELIFFKPQKPIILAFFVKLANTTGFCYVHG